MTPLCVVARLRVGELDNVFFFSSRRRHTRYWRDWSSDVCSSDLALPRSTKLLNYLHAFYGIGALLGPLVASALLAIHWEWNTVYLVWCVLSMPLVIGSAILLRPQLLDISSQQVEQHVSGNVAVAALKLSVVWLGALFLFLYVGAEVGVGNWGYSFLFYDRHLRALLAAWVMSAYWLSLTLGRFLLSSLANQLHLSVAGTISSCLV